MFKWQFPPKFSPWRISTKNFPPTNVRLLDLPEVEDGGTNFLTSKSCKTCNISMSTSIFFIVGNLVYLHVGQKCLFVSIKEFTNKQRDSQNFVRFCWRKMDRFFSCVFQWKFCHNIWVFSICHLCSPTLNVIWIEQLANS